MAEIEDRTTFAELLYEGVMSLKLHPEFKTKRRKRSDPLPANHTSESYIDKISNVIGISSNTLKSWIGQMGKKYIPSRIDDNKLFSIFWVVIKYTDKDIHWFQNIMKTTSIPVIDPPTPSWFRACIAKSKLLLADSTFGVPPAEEIEQVIKAKFPAHSDTAQSIAESTIAGATAERANLAPNIVHNMPNRSVSQFFGRQMHAQLINNWLQTNSSICLISGLGGMGKSTLALEIGNACARLPNSLAVTDWPNFSNIIWVSAELRKLSFNFFLDVIANQLGQVELLEHSLNEKQFIVMNALFSASQSGKILIIVDNIEQDNADILSFLLQLPANIKIILTSRDHEKTLFQTHTSNLFSMVLGGFEEAEALSYFKHTIEVQQALALSSEKRDSLTRISQSPLHRIKQLIQVTAGNPKAMELVIAYIADNQIDVERFIEEITKSSYSLNEIFDYIFGHTWKNSSEPVKKLWMVMHFFQTPPDESVWSAAAGIDLRSFHQAVNELRAHALIQTVREGANTYYTAHQIVIAYGEQQTFEYPDFLDHAKQRLAEYYLDYLDQRLRNDAIDHDYWSYLPNLQIPEVKNEWPNIHYVLQWTEQQQKHDMFIQFILRLSHFLSRINIPLRIELAMKAANIAHMKGLWQYEAIFRIDAVSWACLEVGKLDVANKHIQLAIQLLDQVKPTISDKDRDEYCNLRALAYHTMARYYIAKQDLRKASELVTEALAIPVSPIILHRTLLIKGIQLIMEHNYTEALQTLKEAHDVSMSYEGELSIEAYYFLGLAYLHCNEYEQAERSFHNILFNRNNTHQLELIYHKFGMAQLRAKEQQTQSAVQLLNEALSLIDSWEQGIRIRHDIVHLLEQIQDEERDSE